MEVLHFPDDPRPPWLVHPVLALGNFDGLHRGHLKIIERVKRGAVEHGGIADGDDVRSASAAGGAPRQGAAAPDDKRSADRRARQGGDPLRRRGALHARAVAVGSGDVRAHGAGRMAARVGSLGRREFPLRTRAQRQLHGCCGRWASGMAFAPKRSIRSATRNSSSAAPASGVWWRRDAWTRRPRCSAIRTRCPARSSRGGIAAASWGFPPPIS